MTHPAPPLRMPLLPPRLPPHLLQQAAVLRHQTVLLLRPDIRWYEFNAECNRLLPATAFLQISALNTMAFVDGQRNKVDALLSRSAKKGKKGLCARCTAQSRSVTAEA